jgi:SAM-dependent methyltransferase
VGFDFAGTYDELNPGRDDHRFYLALADEIGAGRVLDLGCGTGTLTRAFGRPAVGLDPDPEMLRVAREQPGGELVDWRLGHSDRADDGSADLAVLTGHAAQVFRDESSWAAALRDLHRALVPGGVLAFESRNPGARAWEGWNRAETLRFAGPVEFWHETAWVELPLVAYDTFTHDPRTSETTADRDVLAFRPAEALIESLAAAGFAVAEKYGDWERGPLTAEAAEIILVARRR